MATVLTFPPVSVCDTLAPETPTETLTAQATTTITGGTIVAPNDARIHYRGAGGFAYGTVYPKTTTYGPNSAYPNTWNSPSAHGVEFVHTGTTFEVMFYETDTHATIRIKVDGRRVYNLPVGIGAMGAGNRHVRKYVFPTSKTRRITLEWAYLSFGGVFVNTATDNITAATAFGVRTIMFGDSITGGSNYSTGLVNGTYPNRLADYIGADDPWNVSAGGTGYITPGAYVTFDGRKIDATSWSPNVVLIWGGYNDYFTNTAAAVGAAAATFFADVKAGVGSAEIYVAGIWSPVSPPISQMTLADAAILASATAASLPFISPLTGNVYNAAGTLLGSVGPFIANSSDVTNYIGADNTHPNDAGDAHIAAKLRDALLFASGGNTQALADVAVTATLTATGAVGSGHNTGGGAVTAAAALTATGGSGANSAAGISPVATLHATGIVARASGAARTATATLTASGVSSGSKYGAAAVSASAALAATATTARFGAAALTVTAAVTAARRGAGGGGLTATASLSASGVITITIGGGHVGDFDLGIFPVTPPAGVLPSLLDIAVPVAAWKYVDSYTTSSGADQACRAETTPLDGMALLTGILGLPSDNLPAALAWCTPIPAAVAIRQRGSVVVNRSLRAGVVVGDGRVVEPCGRSYALTTSTAAWWTAGYWPGTVTLTLEAL